MHIVKALLVALGSLVGFVIAGTLLCGFLRPGFAYTLGQIGAFVYPALAIWVFFRAKRRFAAKKKDGEIVSSP
jgi:hypothetical protein